MKSNHYGCTLIKGTILQSPELSCKVEDVLEFGGFGISYKVSTDGMQGNIPIHTFLQQKNISFVIAASGTTVPEVLNCIIWQFHHYGTVAGNNNNYVDINKCFGTYADLKKFV